MNDRRADRRRDDVSATELAEMGFCEKRVQLAHLHGKQATAEQRRAMARGLVAHRRYFDEGMASTSDRRCFVSTCVFGPDAVETHVLRAYRDVVLMRRLWGRWAVAMYYWAAPAVCVILNSSPTAATAVRGLLRSVGSGCRKAIGLRCKA
jgi:hypothetical protein